MKSIIADNTIVEGVRADTPINPSGISNRVGLILFLSAVLIVVTLAVYMQTGNQPFINIDDNTYVTDNPYVKGGITWESIRWPFTATYAANWHPVTWLSHMTDVQLFGMNPRGHHLTSVAIHTISASLLFILLIRISGALWQSLFVAAMFALHPLHVESVAWVSERKDVLSTFFMFLTLLLYSEFAVKRKPLLYILALAAFMLGLMSKPMLVTVPVIMLLLDYWPLNRFNSEEQGQVQGQLVMKLISLVKEKVPFFICSILSCIITIHAQHSGGAMPDLKQIPFVPRIENVLISYVKYIGKTVWPHDLAVYYPFPLHIPIWQAIASLLILLVITVAAVRYGRRFPFIAVGWFWFVVTLVPVIGIIQVGGQAMSDRYSYIPLIGLFMIAAWGVSGLACGVRHRQYIVALLAGSIITVSTVLTWQQLGYWKDSISLYRHTVNVTTDNNFIYLNLGVALATQGYLDEAVVEYGRALRINPFDAKAYYNRAIIYARKGDFNAAINEYQAAIRIDYYEPDAHCNLGIAFMNTGNLNAAVSEFQTAVQISPGNKLFQSNLNRALTQQRIQSR